MSVVNPMSLEGKRILFFGEESALNQAISECLLGLGAQVIPCMERDLGGIEQSVLNVLSGDPVDGFVFARMHSDFRPIRFNKRDIVQEIISDNFGSFVEIVRVLVKGKLLNDRASIVAMSSISSIRAMKTKTAFCAAKAALDAAVRCLALELGENGIRVNSILKGGTTADMDKSHIQVVNSLNDGATAKRQFLGLTKADEIANLTAFLLSDSVLTMTGSSIVIDGGYTL